MLLTKCRSIHSVVSYQISVSLVKIKKDKGTNKFAIVSNRSDIVIRYMKNWSRSRTTSTFAIEL